MQEDYCRATVLHQTFYHYPSQIEITSNLIDVERQDLVLKENNDGSGTIRGYLHAP